METAPAAPGQGQEQEHDERDSPRGIAEIQKVFIVRVMYRVSLRNSGGKGIEGTTMKNRCGKRIKESRRTNKGYLLVE